MRRAAANTLATVALTAGLGLTGAGVASAAVGEPAEMEYPGTTTPPGAVLDQDEEAATGGTTTTRSRVRSVTSSRATLPFTGGELVVLVTAGAGAVGAGAALVVATRRRGPQSA